MWQVQTTVTVSVMSNRLNHLNQTSILFQLRELRILAADCRSHLGKATLEWNANGAR